MRESIRRAVRCSDQLTNADLFTLHAVHDIVASWSKRDEFVFVAEIARLAGLSERQARRSLAKLARLRIIEWEPRRGRGVMSRVGLPVPESEDERPSIRQEPL
jgi:MarR-like DNA-binding transcriptional regulator SgrR of sgrS sRNA